MKILIRKDAVAIHLHSMPGVTQTDSLVQFHNLLRSLENEWCDVRMDLLFPDKFDTMTGNLRVPVELVAAIDLEGFDYLEYKKQVEETYAARWPKATVSWVQLDRLVNLK